MYKQEPPFCVQIELVQGCNLLCAFCGTRGLERRAHYMEARVLASVMEQLNRLGWNSRIELAMHGEPTMHPKLLVMLGLLHDMNYTHHRQTMLLSNGFHLIENYYHGLRDFVDIVAVDVYNTDNRGRLFTQWAEDHDIKVHRYPGRGCRSPHERWPASELPAVIAVQDITEATKGTHSTLNNHCGAGGVPLRCPLMQRCAKPFRELAIRWDGNVALCCNDFRGVYKLGNILEDGIEAIWNGKRMEAARRLLYANDRMFKPCRWCDAKSYRVGLLPDKLGKQTMTPPTQYDIDMTQNAVLGQPYSVPEPRKWEQEGDIRCGKLCV